MNFVPIITATLVVGALGLIVGILLGVAGHIFEVKQDAKEAAIRAALPGNNCGACGFPGCDGLAKAIFEGEAPANSCPVGGQASAEVIEKILAGDFSAAELEAASETGSAVSGEAAAEAPKKRPIRKASCARPEDCVACHICENSCRFGAVRVPEDQPVVDEDKCIGCGLCVRECPREVLEIVVHES